MQIMIYIDINMIITLRTWCVPFLSLHTAIGHASSCLLDKHASSWLASVAWLVVSFPSVPAPVIGATTLIQFGDARNPWDEDSTSSTWRVALSGRLTIKWLHGRKEKTSGTIYQCAHGQGVRCRETYDQSTWLLTETSSVFDHNTGIEEILVGSIKLKRIWIFSRKQKGSRWKARAWETDPV